MSFDIWLKAFNDVNELNTKIILLSLLERGNVVNVREVNREEVVDCFDIINSIIRRNLNVRAGN